MRYLFKLLCVDAGALSVILFLKALLVHCFTSCQLINHYTIFGWTDKVLSSTLIIHHLVYLLSDGDHSLQGYVIKAYHTDMVVIAECHPIDRQWTFCWPAVVNMVTFEIAQIPGRPMMQFKGAQYPLRNCWRLGGLCAPQANIILFRVSC